MTYEWVKAASAMTGLIIFIALFAGAVIHAFRPGNRSAFEAARYVPLQADPDDIASEDKNGR